MARRHRGKGKSVTGIEMGFIICQALALMMLLGVLMAYIAARADFEPGEEYLPVTITYTKSEERIETYMEDGKERTRYRYDNSYYYEVDGVRYDGQVKDSARSVSPGEQAIKYYNPKDPNELSAYQSLSDEMGETKGVAVAAVIFEAGAVVFLIMIRNKKRRFLQRDKDYEESIRQDIETNREIYQSLEVSINKEKIFAKLEPLRKRIYKNQKAIERMDKRKVSSGSGIINVIYHLIAAAIDAIRRPRIQNQLDMDNTLFYKEYKKDIAEPVLNQIFEEVQYRPSQGFSINELESFRVIATKLNGIESEDYIEGVYKGIRYRQADVKKKMSAENSELLNMQRGLRGRVSVYDFNKSIQGEMVIKTKETNAYIKNMEKVVMENLQFNEKFEVYATDAHLVFYVLTPQFMEYLLQLKLWGDTVFRFADDKVYILRNQVSGIFEPNMGNTLDVTYEIGKSYNELKEILDFIDILKLEKAETAAADTIPLGYSRLKAEQPVGTEESMEMDRATVEERSIDEGSQEKSSSKFQLKLE